TALPPGTPPPRLLQSRTGHDRADHRPGVGEALHAHPPGLARDNLVDRGERVPVAAPQHPDDELLVPVLVVQPRFLADRPDRLEPGGEEPFLDPIERTVGPAPAAFGRAAHPDHATPRHSPRSA